MKATEFVESMIETLQEVQKDAEKHDKGQKAAGTRVRKAMQGLKTDAQELRKLVLEGQKKAAEAE
jgi:hypothetical protein